MQILAFLCNAEQLAAPLEVEVAQSLIIADPCQRERDLGRANDKVKVSQ